MAGDMAFLRIRPSNGLLIGKDGKTVGIIWGFRPDVEVVDKHWFKSQGDEDDSFLRITVCRDNFPIDCRKIFPDSDGPDQFSYALASDEEVLKLFEFCCGLLSKTKNDREALRLGSDIIDSTLSGETG